MSLTIPSASYPESQPDRDRWILARRPARARVDVRRPHAFLIERERAASGELAEVTTIFLTGRECPWRCLMCDLWKHTTEERTPVGAIPAQIDFALADLGRSRREEASTSPAAYLGDNSVRQEYPKASGEPGASFPLTPGEREQARRRGGSSKGVEASSAAEGVPPLLGERAGVRGNETHELAGETINPTGRTAYPQHLKLYNSGSFFDRAAVPIEDYEPIARRAAGFERVIVESHPALIGDATLRFRDLLAKLAATDSGHLLSPSLPSNRRFAGALSLSPRSCLAGREPERGASHQGIPPLPSPLLPPASGREGEQAHITAINTAPQLEVAMGLETAHPEVLAKLNKRVTLDRFAEAASFLRREGIALRVFVLVKPPFMDEGEALEWAVRSAQFAFDCGAEVVSLIPTRFGNGALEALAAEGQFAPPKLGTLEAAFEQSLGLGRGRVFADMWDLEKFSTCPACLPARRERMNRMNLEQSLSPPIRCEHCT